MTRPFITPDFLLENETARRLYHDHAGLLPIIDYHCHLSPRKIAENRPFESITQLWLGGDHYKWRAMRANGISERFITGDASPWEKFQKWAETVPRTFRNPLYHWTHLELSTAFGIDTVLNPATAREIYDRCNEMLSQPDMTPVGLMRRYNVEVVCTTDDPADDLHFHHQISQSGITTKVLPTWRPDKAANIGDPAAYNAYLDTLSDAAGIEIVSFDTLIDTLQRRHDYFHESGCRLADHGLTHFPYAEATDTELHRIFNTVRSGKAIDAGSSAKLQTAILLRLCHMNHSRGWVQQFHFGPMRNVNTRAFRALGPDTGFDTIGDYSGATHIAAFLDRLESDGHLAKSILYNLNPADNVWVAAMIANFQDGSCPGKMQFGSAWWFNDHISGMEDQMNALSTQGLLSRFVGMLTDSRSFLSYPRHAYFRRILCNLLARDIERGLIPAEEYDRVAAMVRDISYFNAKNYFNF
ncbi:MAG: glucuronate isomerase [Muribaculaceae bacterium]|nr:glucuronate isomerase [Muribaculaceae bacterium]